MMRRSNATLNLSDLKKYQKSQFNFGFAFLGMKNG